MKPERAPKRKRVARDDAGFTLVELLIVVVIEAMIVAALGSAFVLVMNSSTTVKESLLRTNDARFVASYIVSDARNSSGPETSLSDTVSCPDLNPPVSGSQTAVVRFNWYSTSSVVGAAPIPNVVNYVLVSNALLRRYCRAGSLVSDTALATSVASVAVVCAPTADCTGTPTTIAATITETQGTSAGAAYQYSVTGAFRKALAVGAPLPCPSHTPVLLTGFESGTLGPLNLLGAIPTFDSAVKRNGTYSLKIPKASTGANYEGRFVSGSVLVLRFGLYLDSLPSANVDQLAGVYLNTATSGVNLKYDAASQKLQLGFSNGSVATAATTVAPATWYRIELKVDVGTNPWKASWRIDSVDQPQASATVAAGTVYALLFGSSTTPDVFTAHYDDVLDSQTGSDYPLGDGKVLSLVPNASPLSGDVNPTNFQNDNGNPIDANSYTRLTDIPMTSLSTYVKQTTASTTSYVQLAMADTTETCIDGVAALAAYHTATGGSDKTVIAKTSVFDGSTETIVFSGNMYGSLAYSSAMVAPTSGTWTQSQVNGLVARVGYASDVVPVPDWDALMLEYDVQP